MANKINEAAVLHLLAGKLEKREEVPVGSHNCSGVKVVVQFPEFAAVTRGEGTAGEGYDEKESPALLLKMDAVLLYLERSLIKGGVRQRKLWAECIRDQLRGMTAQPPKDALTALLEVQGEQPKSAPEKRKTAAKRTGADEIKIFIADG